MANGGDKPPFVESRNSADLRTLVNYLKRRQTEETSGSENVESPKYFKTPRPRSDMPQELDGEVKTLNKQVFEYLEKVNGRNVNILEGLELHHGVFSSEEQERIVDLVYQLEKMGKNGQLKGRTFSAPNMWMRGKGRVTIQFGCCYNYAIDKKRNLPGILQNELVEAMPPLFNTMIKKLLADHVLPSTCVPDTCIVNIYDEGNCIPPHVDSHDFHRPFCTISFLSECNILFGSNLKATDAGEFSGPCEIPLPVGSVLVFDGNGANVAKHCVPAVPTKRISITFRKMVESKWPDGFVPEPDLLGPKPLIYEPVKPKSGSSISKPNSGSSISKPRRLDPSGINAVKRLLGSHIQICGQSQTRQDLDTKEQ